MMMQKVEWDLRRGSIARDRAICNVSLIMAALVLLLVVPAARAIAPPRPGQDVALPEAWLRWPDPRPGLPSRKFTPHTDAKSAVAQHRLLVLPGEFADRAGTVRQTTLQTLFTGPLATGTVRNYWQAASGGRLDVLGQVQVWRRAPQTAGYYAGGDDGMNLWGAPRNAGGFVRDMVALFDAAGLNWGQFDNDGPDGVANSGDDDGYVDCVVVVHAGRGGECGTADLWSHAFFLAGWGYGEYTTAIPRAGGGFIKVNDYILVPEQSCTGGVIEIGVICHEYGHVLGLPDLYDAVGGRPGAGGWCLMGTGSWGGDGQQPERPSRLSAWCRRDLGWTETVEILCDGPLTLPAVDIEDRVASVRDQTLPPGEFFLVENRARRGCDVSLPGEGLLIWHIDGSVLAETRPLNRINAGSVLGVALEQADGLNHLAQAVGSNRGDAGDPWPGATLASRFASDTSPASRTNAGLATAVAIAAIPTPGDFATVAVTIGVSDLDTTPPAVAVLAPAGGEDWTLGAVQTVRWQASDAGGVTEVQLFLSRDGGLSFPVRLAQGLSNTGTWSGSLGSVPGEALVLQVRARDAAGNWGEAAGGMFALRDRFAPGILFWTDIAADSHWQAGQQATISWHAADNVAVTGVDLQLSCDDGSTWQVTSIVNQPAIASALWTVPDLVCTTARLRAVARDAAGNVGWEQSPRFAISNGATAVPDLPVVQLGPCVPNPFNPQAEIFYQLASAGHVRLTLHDAAGRRICTLQDGYLPAGRHSVIWRGRDGQGRAVASGVYWVRASGAGTTALLKVSLVR